MFHYVIFKVLLVSTTLGFALGRKYDLDEESRVLYGENLTEVLNKFRRTPEYVEILLERNAKLQVRIQNIMSQADHYFQSVLDKEIEAKIRDTVEKNPPRMAAFRSKIRRPIKSKIKRRQEPEDADAKPPENPENPDNPDTPGNQDGSPPDDLEGIRKLDEYFAMKRPMTAGETNEWRDWAFDQLPRLIDFIVDPLKSEGRQSSGGITKAPLEVDPVPKPDLPPPTEQEVEDEEEDKDDKEEIPEENPDQKLKEPCRDGKTGLQRVNTAFTLPTLNPRIKKSKNVIMLY